jgi:hypothetical protein
MARVEELLIEVITEVRAKGWTPSQFMREASILWIEDINDQRQNDIKEWNRLLAGAKGSGS